MDSFVSDMVVSGVPKRNGNRHAENVANMTIDLVNLCKTFEIPHLPKTPLKIRAGLHSGMMMMMMMMMMMNNLKPIGMMKCNV